MIQPFLLLSPVQIIEGALTIVFGCVSWMFLPEFPDNNTFLTSEETEFILERIEKDRGDSLPDAITLRKVFEHLSDWKIWIYGTHPTIG
jgi:hypothetical protein